jgi:hypothetical protein
MAPEESVVTDEDPLSFLGSQEPSTEKSEPAADARGEAAAAVATNMENPLEYLGTEQTAENQGSLGNPADFAASAAVLNESAKNKAMVAAVPELKEMLKTLPPGSETAEKIRSTIAEASKNHFELEGNGWSIEGQRNGVVCLFGKPEIVKAILEKPESFLPKEVCALLRAAKKRHQLHCPTPEQQRRIQELAKEYTIQYIQMFKQQIKKEIESREREKKQESSAELSGPVHAEPKIVQNKKEESRARRPEMILTEFLSKMFLKNLRALGEISTRKMREEREKTKEELAEMEKKYWKTLEGIKKDTIQILDSKAREKQKDAGKITSVTSR